MNPISTSASSARYAPSFIDSLLALGLVFGLAVVMAVGITLAAGSVS